MLMSADSEKAEQSCQLPAVFGYGDVRFCRDLGRPVMYVTNRPWSAILGFLHSWSIKMEDHDASTTMAGRPRKAQDVMWLSSNKRCCKGYMPLYMLDALE